LARRDVAKKLGAERIAETGKIVDSVARKLGLNKKEPMD
jgi:hypothetical protein